jgi:CheY-like chemotaxis protein
VVDDNEDLRMSLCRLLSLHGYQVAAAGDGLAALRLASEVKPHVIVVDIGLPGMDGYELARRLRLEFPTVRMVAVTGYGQASDRTRSRAAGFDAHLVKPVGFDTLRPFLDDPHVSLEAERRP